MNRLDDAYVNWQLEWKMPCIIAQCTLYMYTLAGHCVMVFICVVVFVVVGVLGEPRLWLVLGIYVYILPMGNIIIC